MSLLTCPTPDLNHLSSLAPHALHKQGQGTHKLYYKCEVQLRLNFKDERKNMTSHTYTHMCCEGEI